jgi:hypothetical protein
MHLSAGVAAGYWRGAKTIRPERHINITAKRAAKASFLNKIIFLFDVAKSRQGEGTVAE